MYCWVSVDLRSHKDLLSFSVYIREDPVGDASAVGVPC